MKVFGWIAAVIVSVLMCLLLELNRNTFAGWLLFALVFVLLVMLIRSHILMNTWYERAFVICLYTALCAGIFFLSWPPLKQVKAYDTKEPVRTETVSTDKGDVQGVVIEDGTVELFAGIPYAKPPVGELRWKKPQEADAWEGVRQCDHFAPMSMQARSLPLYDSLAQIIGYHDYHISFDDQYREAVSEDSLYLNVWRPAEKGTGLPVIVYIHGGSLQTGQPWYDDYSGKGFASDGVICVNMGYRLGIFGFLATEELAQEDADHTAGNYGLLDQIMALEWVRDNIASFGGDPDNVTLIGESAGSVCVDALCVSPLAKGLFKRAVMESSSVSCAKPPHSYRLFDEALASGKELMARQSCSSIEELRALPAEKLVNEQNTQHHITIDGYVLPDTPYNLRKAGVHNEEAVIHGYNAEESGPFLLFSHTSMKNYEKRVRAYFGEYTDEVLKLYPASSDEEADQAWAKIYGALFFNYSHYCLNRLETENGVPAYEYLFSKTNGRLGCWHSGELVYAFANIPEDSKLYDEEDRRLSRLMHEAWISFAINGVPAANGMDPWIVSSDSSQVMEFGAHTGMINEPDTKLYEIMDRMYGFRQ